MKPASPYLVPGFYDRALAAGKHRDIVGGRWDETGRAQMRLLQDEGLGPHHHLLDIGAGALRLGCKAVPYLDAGHYWATDASLALLQRGHSAELDDPSRLSTAHLIEDATFDYPGVPDTITHAMAWGVFTHLPPAILGPALVTLGARFPALDRAIITLFLCDPGYEGALRQPDGVVTHPDKPPYHTPLDAVGHLAALAGLSVTPLPHRLPRGQIALRFQHKSVANAPTGITQIA